jgi:hypothetical protein
MSDHRRILIDPVTQQPRKMRCHRCKMYFDIKYMVPLVDQYGRHDGQTYRPWCLPCWFNRQGALPSTDPDCFIPRSTHTRRMDRLAMGVKQNSARELYDQTRSAIPIARDAFSEVHMPPGKLEQMLELDTVSPRKFTLPPNTPTAQDILDRAGKLTPIGQEPKQQNDSTLEQSAHAIRGFRGHARPSAATGLRT